ncbi:MAG: sulfite exporter TauE/SafE family protein [Alphaproteobacteria bacterium]
MQIYLPIAEMAVPAETMALVSAFVGFLSGIFGIGGGFLTTPFLIFMGIPPTVAVGTQASQLVASSTTGVIAHWGRGNVDIKIGGVMMLGGLFGTGIGTLIFMLLEYIGQIDFAISALYIVVLGSIGALMLFNSTSQLFVKKPPVVGDIASPRLHSFIESMPYKMRFPRSRLYISVLVPVLIGFVGGILTSILGIGGGFIIVPAMIYLLGMPALLVTGTSLYQMVFTTAFATIMHAIVNQSVDIILGLVLIVGGVIGAQAGVAFSHHVKGHYARITLAIIVLGVCLRLLLQFFVMPHELFSTVIIK